jgi:O-antigen ligase
MHYQTAPGTVRYEHAHNDYLEVAADMGIPAALLLFGSLWLLAWKVARKSLTFERRSEKRLAAACAGAMIALLIHSLTDFNLQIPANALIFSWVAGTAAALTSLPAHSPDQPMARRS